MSFEKKCAVCGVKKSKEKRLLKCAKCTSVRYCGVGCQRLHWSEHKPRCKEIVAQQAVDAARNNELYDLALDYLVANDSRGLKSVLEGAPHLVD